MLCSRSVRAAAPLFRPTLTLFRMPLRLRPVLPPFPHLCHSHSNHAPRVPSATPPPADAPSPRPPATPAPTPLTSVAAALHPPLPPDAVWTIPNALTGLRLLLAPVVAGQILMGLPLYAVATLTFAAGLDYLDGAAARWLQQSSLLGSFLDPLADKVLVACALGSLCAVGVLHPALCALVIGRDLGLVAGSFYFRSVTRRPGEAFFDLSTLDYSVTPSMLSKLNTVATMGITVFGVAHAAWGLPDAAALTAWSWVVAGTTVGSGAQYWFTGGGHGEGAGRGGASGEAVRNRVAEVREGLLGRKKP